MAEQPKRPSDPVWRLILLCALAALGYFEVLDHRIAYGAAAALLIGFLVLDARRRQRFERDLLDWKIENARAWVVFFEAKMREPQPWFDDEDPEEYRFWARHGLENWKSTLSELEARRT